MEQMEGLTDICPSSQVCVDLPGNLVDVRTDAVDLCVELAQFCWCPFPKLGLADTGPNGIT